MKFLVGLCLAVTVAARAATNTTYPGAIAPPPGVTPDLQNPTEAGRKANLVIFIVLGGVATILFALRMFVKVRLIRQYYLEDLTCTLSWLSLMTYSACVVTMVHWGEGYHAYDLSPHDYSEMLKWLYASSIVYVPAAFFTKATLLLLVARVFYIKASVSRAIYIFVIGLAITYIPIQVMKTVICNPIRSYWEPGVPGHCLNQRNIFLADTSIAIFTDLVILILPVPLAWRLRLSKLKKLKIMAILGAGGVATATTIWRLVKAIGFMNSSDVSADFVILTILTMVELSIGLTCSCIPSISILINQRTRLFGSSKATSGDPRQSAQDTWAPNGSTPRQSRRPTAHRVDADREATLLNPGERGNSPGQSTSMEKVNAADGIREGWLDPGAGQSLETGTRDVSREIERELERIHVDGLWDEIWDGTQTNTASFPSSRCHSLLSSRVGQSRGSGEGY